MIPSSSRRKLLPLLLAAAVLLTVVFAASTGGAAAAGSSLTYAELPDPLDYGQYEVQRTDPIVLGTYSFEEPNGRGIAPTGSNVALANAQVRGVLYTPEGKSGKSPLIFFVHGNHSSCDSGSGPACTIFKRNDEGYAYMAQNLASWGYDVFSLDQDELMSRQDSSFGKGMHARRLLIMAALDKLREASEGIVPAGADADVAELLGGKLDMTRIGLMGHSRGGDAVSSFVQYNQTRPAGERFPLRGVISIAPVDYERHAPYGVPYMTMIGTCDGDVSNLQGARLYERSQYQNDDPYPRFQVLQVGGNHDAYNTVWQVDGDDSRQADAACHPAATVAEAEETHGIRLSGEAGPLFTEPAGSKSYVIENGHKLDPAFNTRISGDPALMGDQEKMGLATLAAFLRRYVGGEGAFEPYLTGELAAEGKPSIPQSACPTSIEGARIPCIDRVADSYTAPPQERMDVLRPDTEHPTTVSALGTRIEASGFANPYPKGGGVQPRPATTATGIDWCDPDPQQTEPDLMNEGEFPDASKWCPQPAAHTLGGQGALETPGAQSTAKPRENAPVNGSYGRQLSLAWEGEASMGLPIPAADGDVSGYRALYMAAAVNFFDPRNPPRGEEGLWNPEAAPQNFTIAVSDAEGHEGTVEADDPDFGTAMQQTPGSTSDRVHVMLRDLRVPLAEFAGQGVNLSKVRQIELRFGEEGMPGSGSIQLADVRFEQPASGYSNVLLDSTEPNAGPGEGEPTSGPNPVKEMEEGVYARADGEYAMPDVTQVPGANVWTVDDDGVQCPNAQFEHIQEAVDYSNPWDTIVVCPGVYAESSQPIDSAANPVGEGQMNGLTITKPVKIIGAGASKVTIKPASTLTTLGGASGTLRDGGGNVITVSRQSLGSTEYDEHYVDISGVKIESGPTTAEAGVAFFNASGRIADSEIGTIRAANGNGWGVVETNSLIGEGEGTPERQVTLEDDVIKGYAAGAVLFDGSRGGIDGAATNTERSGIDQVGYVLGTRIEGSGGSSSVPQTGIAFRSGARGEVLTSTITKNHSTTAATSSYGILAADSGPVSVEESNLTANGEKGYALYNGNADASAVSTGAPIEAIGDFWGGSGGAPITGESKLAPTEEEGVEGPIDTTPVASAPVTVPTAAAVPAMPDAAPVGAIVDPGGEGVEAGVPIAPVVFTEDDYGVKSVSLRADGAKVGTLGVAPYVFRWKPDPAQIGSSVRLEATITDSSGQVTTSEISVPVVTSAAEAGAKAAEEAAARKAAEEAAAKKATEDAVKAAEAAQREAREAKEAAAAAKLAATPISTGKAVKNKKKGTVRLTVIVPSPGSFSVFGPGVAKVSGRATGPGKIQVLIKARGKALKTLKKKGKVRVTVKVKFTGPERTRKTTTRTVALVKK